MGNDIPTKGKASEINIINKSYNFNKKNFPFSGRANPGCPYFFLSRASPRLNTGA